MLRRLQEKRPLDILLPALVATLFGIGFYIYPPELDDLAYRLPFKAYFLDGAPYDTAELWRQIVWRHLHDNSRLANVAMQLLMLLPAWLTAAMSALVVFVTLRLMQRFGQYTSSCTVLLAGALYVLATPWIDHLYVFDWQLNYVWGGCLMMWFLMVFTLHRRKPDTIFLLGVLLGAWQECASLPAFIAVIGTWIFYRDYRDERTFAAGLGLLAGLLWLYMSPGGQDYRGGHWAPFTVSILSVLTTMPALIYCGCLLVRYLMRRHLEIRHFILGCVAVASAGVLWCYHVGPSVATCSVLASVTGLSMLADRTTGLTIVRILCGALYIYAVAGLAATIGDIWRLRDTYDKVVSRYRASGDTTIFADLTLRERMPLLSLRKIKFEQFTRKENIELLSAYYGTRTSMIHVLPRELEHFTPTAAESLGDGFYSYAGYLVGPAYSDGIAEVYLDAVYDGQIRRLFYFTTPFTGTDGETYGWYFVRNVSESIFCPVPDSVAFPEQAIRHGM